MPNDTQRLIDMIRKQAVKEGAAARPKRTLQTTQKFLPLRQDPWRLELGIEMVMFAQSSDYVADYWPYSKFEERVTLPAGVVIQDAVKEVAEMIAKCDEDFYNYNIEGPMRRRGLPTTSIHDDGNGRFALLQLPDHNDETARGYVHLRADLKLAGARLRKQADSMPDGVDRDATLLAASGAARLADQSDDTILERTIDNETSLRTALRAPSAGQAPDVIDNATRRLGDAVLINASEQMRTKPEFGPLRDQPWMLDLAIQIARRARAGQSILDVRVPDSAPAETTEELVFDVVRTINNLDSEWCERYILDLINPVADQ